MTNEDYIPLSTEDIDSITRTQVPPEWRAIYDGWKIDISRDGHNKQRKVTISYRMGNYILHLANEQRIPNEATFDNPSRSLDWRCRCEQIGDK